MGDVTSTGVLMLADLHRIFLSKRGKGLMEENTKPALKTEQLLKILENMDESPWKSYRRDGSPLNSRDLSQLLKPYGIKSTNIWWNKESNGKGHYLNVFEDAANRAALASNCGKVHPFPDSNGPVRHSAEGSKVKLAHE
jgi:hypothetical protein